MPPRFITDRALFDSFPTARKDVGVEPHDIPPTVLARNLMGGGRIKEALSLCAYMLSRRDAVEWGCRSLRVLLAVDESYSTPELKAAELWAQDPGTLRQDSAREVGAAARDAEPGTWMARAAGWSGGNFGPTLPFPVPSHLTAVGVRIGLLLAAYPIRDEADKLERGRACVEDAIRIAEGDRRS